VSKYQKRVSGPLLDRIDIHIQVPRVEFDKLNDDRLGESSCAIQARVEVARQIQRERFMHEEKRSRHSTMCNADMTTTEVRKNCILDETGRGLMKSATNQLQLTARSYHRILKLARTIADLAGAPVILPIHLAEALQYRPRMDYL
jgi:magnesium chelatase family protein